MAFAAAMNLLTLESSELCLTVCPDLGGRIMSIVDRRSGREWLWRNPHLLPHIPFYGDNYTKILDGGGWDDILPSISPCHLLEGSAIPDHGDIVCLPSSVVSATNEQVVLSTDVRSLPLRFTREIRLQGNQFRIGYSLESLASRDLPYLWAAHPLFKLEPGMQIVGIEGISFTEAAVMGLPPDPSDPIPDFTSHSFKPSASKRFSRIGSVHRVGLRHPDGSSIQMTWNAREIPYLGLWLNLGAWSGCGSPPYFNLGVEPITSPYDSLADAVDAGSAMFIHAGQKRSWSLAIEVHPPAVK